MDPNSNLNESEHYLLARHEITTNLDEICHVAQRVLKSNGRLAMVHRPDRFLDIIEPWSVTILHLSGSSLSTPK